MKQGVGMWLCLAAAAVLVVASMEPPEDAALQWHRHHRRRRPSPHHDPVALPSPPPPPPTGPRPSPPAPTPPQGACNCTRPIEPDDHFFDQPGNNASTPTATNCVAALAGLSPCSAFFTRAEETTPTPESSCCRGLEAFLNGGSGELHCLCPMILGEVNKVLPRPVDPVRIMYLPVACSIHLPPELMFTCYTGHLGPCVVGRFSQLWETVAP